jgi:hypothetical protein
VLSNSAANLAMRVFEAFVLVGEGQLRAFAVAGLGDAVGDRVLGQ